MEENEDENRNSWIASVCGALRNGGLSAQAADEVVIGYSAPGHEEAHAQIQAGLVNSAEAKGWTVLTTTSGGDAQKQLEEGAENADAIAAVNGVDCLWVGHFASTASPGIPGQFEHPKYLAAVERIAEAARTHERALGRLVASVEEGVALYGQGFDFCCYSGDVWVFQQALTETISQLRVRPRTIESEFVEFSFISQSWRGKP